MMLCVPVWLAGLVLAAPPYPPNAHPADHGDFSDFLYVTDPAPFEAVFHKAHCSTTRIVILGDSQETTPGGAGNIYIPRLSWEFASRAGNVPETQLARMATSTGSGMPYADWLLRSANPPGGVTASRVPADQLPPGWTACKTSTAGGSSVDPNQYYGNIVMLQPDCANVHPHSGLAHGGPYVDIKATWGVEVFGLTNTSSGEVRVRVRPNATSATNFFAPATQTFTSSMELRGPTGSIRRQTFGPLNFFDEPYMQVDISGSDPGAFTDVLAVRYVNLSNSAGWSINSFSQEGYKASDVLVRHASCGAFLNAAEPDVVFLMFGANDAGAGLTPAQFRANISSLIDFVRQSTSPSLPIIIFSDPPRGLLTDVRLANMNGYPQACRELISQLPGVAFVDSRGAMRAQGWNEDTLGQFTGDLVHYLPNAAILKARTEAWILFDAFDRGAHDDCNGNGIDDACDIERGTSTDFNLNGIPDECELWGDINHDGSLDLQDVLLFAGEVAEGNGLDFNRDGSVDVMDVIDLANVIAGGR